jgi:two-component system invasion response regulator UvrY
MIEICIIDDHAIVREGLKQILEDIEDIKVTGEASKASEFFLKLRTQEWSVIVLDLSLPGRDGLEILREIKIRNKNIRVLVLTMHSEEQYAIRAFKAGASGFLNKDSAPTELVNAIRKVAKGEKYLSPQLAEKLVDNLSFNESDNQREELSDREFSVLKKLGAGTSITEIADELLLSVKTVSTYRSRILEKLHLSNNADIIRYVINNKIE